MHILSVIKYPLPLPSSSIASLFQISCLQQSCEGREKKTSLPCESSLTVSLACLRNGSLTKISPLFKEAVRRKQVYKFLESEILAMYKSKMADETKLKGRAAVVVLDESLVSTLRATNDLSKASFCCSNFLFFIFNFVSSGISCR